MTDGFRGGSLGADLGLPLLREVPGSSQGPEHHRGFPWTMSTQLKPSGCRPTPLCMASWALHPSAGTQVSPGPGAGFPLRVRYLFSWLQNTFFWNRQGRWPWDSQRRPCRGPSIRPQGLQARCSPRQSGHSHPTRTPDPPGDGGAHGPGPGAFPGPRCDSSRPRPSSGTHPLEMGTGCREPVCAARPCPGDLGPALSAHTSSAPCRVCLASFRPGRHLKATCHLCGWLFWALGLG